MMNARLLIPKHTKIRDTYTIDSLLGEGAFGSVYKARHKYLGMQALKIFHPGAIPKEQEAELFNEAFILSKLTHENIVRVYEANTFDFYNKRYCYIAMELIQGGTLAEYIEQQTRLSLELAIGIEKDICRGLAQLHKAEPPLIHRDVKPQNIMLVKNGDKITAKVSDFGLAKHVDPVTRMTEAAGTLAYLPPEGFWDYETPASDVFSAGIIFYIMLTGISPFKMPSGYKTAKKSDLQNAIKISRNKKPDPPTKYNLDLEPELNEIVLKALEPNIKNRYKNADEFYYRIDQYRAKRAPLNIEEIKKALELGKQYKSLKDAIALLEKVIVQQPEEGQRQLKEKYKDTLLNWKKGIIM